MAEIDRYYTALQNAHAAGDTDSARQIAAKIKTMRGESDQTTMQSIKQGVGNLTAGAVRGAGSIGATLLTPIDALARSVGVENEFIGRRDRRQAMDQGLQELGADPNSMMYKTGKIGGEIAGTAGAGGAIANTLGRLAPAIANAPILQSIASSGMRAGDLGGKMGMVTRALGGATAGGVSAGMIDPETAGTGAALGGALPPMLSGAGKLGSMAKSLITAPKQTDDMVAAVNAARNQGYVIPPTQANPNLKNRLLEGLSGKITTSQNASAKNQVITNQLAAKSLGLPPETTITPEVLSQVRKLGGDAYSAVSNTGMITPSQSYIKALDDIAEPFNRSMQGFPNAAPSPVLKLVESLKSPQFDAASAVSKIKELRTTADDAFRTGNTDIGRASKRAANELENVLEDHLQNIGQPELLNTFREGRKLIAKTYSIEKALNQVSGTVDARKLASQLQKGKPMSDELRSAAEFASRFPKAAQTVEGMGSLPQTSPLDWAAGAGMASAMSNPLGMLSVGARPAARYAALAPITQNRLIQGQGGLLQLPEQLQQFGYQAMPGLMGNFNR
jgi:hypothetical protein